MGTIVEESASPKKVNRVGLTQADYKGKPSTLCKGCGHDSISSQLIKAFYEYGVEPSWLLKVTQGLMMSRTAVPLWAKAPFRSATTCLGSPANDRAT